MNKKTTTLIITTLVSLALNVLGGTGVIDPVVETEPCECTCEGAQ